MAVGYPHAEFTTNQAVILSLQKALFFKTTLLSQMKNGTTSLFKKLDGQKRALSAPTV
jgi:hypothetical protein